MYGMNRIESNTDTGGTEHRKQTKHDVVYNVLHNQTDHCRTTQRRLNSENWRQWCSINNSRYRLLHFAPAPLVFVAGRREPLCTSWQVSVAVAIDMQSTSLACSFNKI